jgi:hypothetical protein
MGGINYQILVGFRVNSTCMAYAQETSSELAFIA